MSRTKCESKQSMICDLDYDQSHCLTASLSYKTQAVLHVVVVETCFSKLFYSVLF